MYKISKLPNVGQISKNTISHLISNILIYPPQNGILNIFNWNKNPFFLLEKNFVIRIFFRKKFSETKIDGIFIFLKRKIFQKSVSDWKIFLEKLLKKNQNFFLFFFALRQSIQKIFFPRLPSFSLVFHIWIKTWTICFS